MRGIVWNSEMWRGAVRGWMRGMDGRSWGVGMGQGELHASEAYIGCAYRESYPKLVRGKDAVHGISDEG